jgi:polyhydroxybutyrate depolymerase
MTSSRLAATPANTGESPAPRPAPFRDAFARLAIICGIPLLVLAGFATAAVAIFWNGALERTQITPGPVSLETGTYEVRLEHDGRQRRYLLHVPPGVTPAGEPLPLVFVLHGVGGSADSVDALTGFVPIADRERFLLAFPSAASLAWGDWRQPAEIDDVDFMRAVVADVSTRLPVDPRRIYATGISAGAVMSNRLACDAADVFAAVAPVVGVGPPVYQTRCRPVRPVSLIIFLSSRDQIVPFEGGGIKLLLPWVRFFPVISAAGFVSFWTQANGCSGPPATGALRDRTTADRSTVVLERYADCRDGSAVDFYAVEGAGHTWPGGRQYLSPLLIGTTNRDVVASELIWQFFAAHPMPAP